MASFSRTTVDVSIETQITTAIVVSTVFLSKITSIFNPDFMVNSYLKRICLWSIRFFEEYGVAPNTTIQSIFELEKHKLEKAEQELVSGALAKLSREYARGEELNVDYIYDNALKYFEKRDLSLRLEKASLLKDAGRYDEAKEILTINPSLENALFRCTDIFDPDFVDKVFSEDNKGILEFPGAVGDLLGSIKRGWLIGILGGFKKGKTNLMLEFAIQSLLSKLNTVMFSLEMQEEDLAKRVYKRISGLGDKEEMFFPMFDCYRNQTGECDMRERPDTRTIRTQGKRELIKYVPDYTPCSFCRGRFDSYVPEIYYENLKVKEFNLKNVRKNLKAFELMYGRRFHLFRYPRFSASYDDIERDLMQLEAREGVIPDVIVVDYANILKPGKYASDKKTDYIDDIWKNLARLAGEKHAIVVTGCQGNRPSLKKEIQEEEDIADWIGILGHVDIFMALNQIPFEKEKQLIRFNLLEHRHRKFSPDRSVIVLQNLDVGQTLLDSEWER